MPLNTCEKSKIALLPLALQPRYKNVKDESADGGGAEKERKNTF